MLRMDSLIPMLRNDYSIILYLYTVNSVINAVISLMQTNETEQELIRSHNNMI